MMGISAPTKKALKERIGKYPNFIETSAFGHEYTGDGSYCVVSPCPYTNRKFFSTVTITDGLISKVK